MSKVSGGCTAKREVVPRRASGWADKEKVDPRCLFTPSFFHVVYTVDRLLWRHQRVPFRRVASTLAEGLHRLRAG